MSDAEVMELLALYGDTSINAFAIYITFTFGYLTVAYFVGARMSKFQAGMATLLYVVAASMPMVAVIANTQVRNLLLETHKTILNTLPLFASTDWVLLEIVVLGGGISASVYFMLDARRNVD